MYTHTMEKKPLNLTHKFFVLICKYIKIYFMVKPCVK